MEIIKHIEQNTEVWLEERKKFIGGSDVASIMGISPWKTRFQLWQEKIGLAETKSNSYILQKGHILEDKARVIYELTYDLDVPPKVVRHKSYKIAQVSLDGLNLEKQKAIEIKYVGEKVFDRVKEEGYIPEHYYPQLQYQLFCTGFDSLDFVAYSEKRDTITVLNVKADKEYIVNMVAQCEEFFWEMNKKIQPRLSESDYKNVRKATIRRTIESLKLMIKAEYPKTNFFKWDGIYMELKDE